MEALENRPPYVMFETRSIEDRDATISAGHYVGRDVIFAIITPAGSKDRIEREADLWFKSLEQQVREERFKPEWLQAYRSRFEEWKRGQEIPVEGTPIANWNMISPSIGRTLLDINIRTVEDLAAAPDSALDMIGMGAVALRQQARAFIESDDRSKAAAKNAALESELATKNQQIEGLERRIGELEALVKAKAKEAA